MRGGSFSFSLFSICKVKKQRHLNSEFNSELNSAFQHFFLEISTSFLKFKILLSIPDTHQLTGSHHKCHLKRKKRQTATCIWSYLLFICAFEYLGIDEACADIVLHITGMGSPVAPNYAKGSLFFIWESWFFFQGGGGRSSSVQGGMSLSFLHRRCLCKCHWGGAVRQEALDGGSWQFQMPPVHTL